MSKPSGGEVRPTRRNPGNRGFWLVEGVAVEVSPSLADFLLARIADDEQAGRNAMALYGVGAAFPLGHPQDPARVLAECEAKRRIETEHVEGATGACCKCRGAYNRSEPYPCGTVRALALPYADHPDYREEWRA